MIKIGLVFVLAVLSQFFGISAWAQSAGEKASVESRTIVEMPNAGLIAKSHFALNSWMFSGGGVLVEWSAAPFTNVNIGLSYSGSGIIGNGDMTWQKVPGVHVKARLMDETLTAPAIAAGVQTQGRGMYNEKAERFQTDSPGAFLALSKSWRWSGYVGWHGGVHYSFDPESAERAASIYIGVEKSLGTSFSLSVEYNATLAKSSAMLTQKGLLNAALRWSLVKNWTVEVQALDVLVHYRNAQKVTRTIGLEYVGIF